MAIFGSILILIFTLLQIYVVWRAASVSAILRRLRRKTLIAAAVVVWAGFVFASMMEHSTGSAWAGALEFIGMNWLAALFLFSVCLLIVDLLTCFGLLMRRFVPALRGAALLAGCALTGIALVQGLRPPVVQDYAVSLRGLPANSDGTVIVVLSDLHLGSLTGRQWLAARVTQAQQLHPDLVVLLGDLFEGHGPPAPELFAEFRRLSAPLGIWAVPGNHESYGRRADLPELLQEAGVQWLANRWAEPRPGLVLAGVEDLTSRMRSERTDDFIAQALAGRPRGTTILLSHSPLQMEEAAGAGVGLMLCGHTHGGQIWPFGYLIRLGYPLLEGKHEVAGMQVIISRGTGTWGPSMRLWRPGEILRIVLHP